MATIEKAFALPVSDLCSSGTRMVPEECSPASRPTGIAQSEGIDAARQTQPTEQDCAADYFLRQGERDRQDRVIREFLNKGKQ